MAAAFRGGVLGSERPEGTGSRAQLGVDAPEGLGGGEVASLAELIGAESILPKLGMTPEVAVLASAGFATLSLVINFWGGVATENKRAELQLEVGAA